MSAIKAHGLIIILLCSTLIPLLSCSEREESEPVKAAEKSASAFKPWTGFRPATEELPREVGEVKGARQVFERFLAHLLAGTLGSEDARAILAGEYQTPANSPPIPYKVQFDRIVRIDDRYAVARVVADVPPTPADLYYFLAKDPTWKMVAFRRFEARDNLLGVLLQHARDPSSVRATERELANVRLAVAPDYDLESWFAENREELESLRKLAASTPAADQGKPAPQVQAAAVMLGLDSAALNSAGVFTARVGGLNRDQVGFMHVGDRPVPPIHWNSWIWIQPLADGWYLFRTT